MRILMLQMKLIISLFLFLPTIVQAVEYGCKVTKKLDSEREYTAQQLSKGQFSVLIEEIRDSSFLSRCSFVSSEGKVTCDRYKVDRVSFDKYVNIKKYYVFDSHFDVQLFSNLTFVENNGRGGIAFGKCHVSAP